MIEGPNEIHAEGIPVHNMPDNLPPIFPTPVIKGTPGTVPSNQALANHALNRIRAARPKVDRWREQAKECDRFDAGRHFDKQIYDALKNEGRPSASINAASKFIDFVSGIERQSMIEAQLVPRDPHNDQAAAGGSLVTKAVEYILQNCNGSMQRSRAFDDCLVRGMGWTDTLYDYSLNPQGMAYLKRIDGHEMLWDTSQREENLQDTRWVAREREIPKSEAIKRFPDFEIAIGSSSGGSGPGDGWPHPLRTTLITEKSAVPVNSTDWPAPNPGTVKLIEYQWYEEVPAIHFYDPLEQKDDWLSEEAFEVYRKKYERLAPVLRRSGAQDLPDEIPHARILIREYKRILIIGRSVVSGPTKLPGNRFSFNCMTGRWDAEEGIWYGYFRRLMDPQRYLTKFANQVMEVIVRSAKGGVVAEADTFEDPVDAERNWSKIGSITYVKTGQMDKWREKQQAEIPAASMSMFQTCVAMLREVTGVNPEISMGAGSADQPALTMRQRQVAAILLLSKEFDSYHAYLKEETATIYAYSQFIADSRWVRVGGPYDAQAIQLVRDPFFYEYDVVLEEGTRDPNVRAQIWSTIEKWFPQLLRANMMLPEFFDYLPWPAKMRHDLKGAIKAQEEQKKQMAAMGINIGSRGKPQTFGEAQAREKQIRAKAALDEAKAVATLENVKSSRAKMLLDAHIKQLEMAQSGGLEQAKLGQQATQGASDELMGLAGLLGKSQGGQQG